MSSQPALQIIHEHTYPVDILHKYHSTQQKSSSQQLKSQIQQKMGSQQNQQQLNQQDENSEEWQHPYAADYVDGIDALFEGKKNNTEYHG